MVGLVSGTVSVLPFTTAGQHPAMPVIGFLAASSADAPSGPEFAAPVQISSNRAVSLFASSSAQQAHSLQQRYAMPGDYLAALAMPSLPMTEFIIPARKEMSMRHPFLHEVGERLDRAQSHTMREALNGLTRFAEPHLDPTHEGPRRGQVRINQHCSCSPEIL
jgi:hypothetical protein